jgi:hypothetical protein
VKIVTLYVKDKMPVGRRDPERCGRLTQNFPMEEKNEIPFYAICYFGDPDPGRLFVRA